MKKYMKKVQLFLLVLAVSFCMHSGSAQAYLSTSQSAVKLEDGALFLVSYSFGHRGHELQLPFYATSSSLYTPNALAYTVVDADGVIVPGTASTIILSNAELGKDWMYTIPKGRKHTFTLIVAFAPEKKDATDYRLQVNHLPFSFDKTQALKLNLSELQYYATPYIN